MHNSLGKCLILIFAISLLAFLMCSGPKTDEDQIRELMKEKRMKIKSGS
jgi:hypothetical protein